MSNKKLFALLLTLALLAGVLLGCAAQSRPQAGEQGAVGDSLSGSPNQNQSGTDVLSDRKLIRKIKMSAQTQDMDAFLSQLQLRIAELGGYIESRDIQNGNPESEVRNRYATLTIRIPAENLDAFVQKVGETSNVISTVETSDDITLQYTATESRLKVLYAEEDRLLAFLAEAKTVSEMLEIEKRLTAVQSEIESIQSQLNVFDNLVDYGTLTLSVQEVRQYTAAPVEDPTLWQRISSGFTGSVQALWRILQDLLVVFVVILPFLLPLAAVGAAILFFIKRKERKRKKTVSGSPKQPNTP